MVVPTLVGVDQTGNNNRMQLSQENNGNRVVIGPGSASMVIMSGWEAALREGRAFDVATAQVELQGNRVLNFVLDNPAGSGENLFVVARKVRGVRSNDKANLSYDIAAVADFDTSGRTAITPTNAWAGHSTTTQARAYAFQDTSSILGGTPVLAGGFIPTTGDVLNLDDDNTISAAGVIPPGMSQAIVAGGTTPCLIGVVYSFYTEPE